MKKPKILPDSVLKTALRGSVPHGKLRKAKIQVMNPSKGLPICGAVKYVKGKDEVEAVLIPRGGGMYSGAVIAHEGEHASVSGKRRKRAAILTELDNQIVQIVEDCYIEQLPLPSNTPKAYKRQRLFPALKDLLTILRNHRRTKGVKTVEQRNGDILIGARALAIATCYDGACKQRKVELELSRVLGKVRFVGVKTAVDAVWRGKASGKNKAIKILQAIVEPENDDELENEPPNRERQGENIEEGVQNEKGMVQMEVVILKPMGASTAREKALSTRYAPSGVLINQARMMNAIINGDSTGLFLKRRKLEQGGVVLIDASGSMECDAQNLQKLCQLIPTAIIAFYSGRDYGRGGKLCIYARNRKRFSGEERTLGRFIMGGNCVDLPALRWLAKMAGPRYIVTDRGYCGGAWGDALASQALTDSMLNRGQLILLPTFDEACVFFDKSHTLHRKAVELFGAGPHRASCCCKACRQVDSGAGFED